MFREKIIEESTIKKKKITKKTRKRNGGGEDGIVYRVSVNSNNKSNGKNISF